MDLMFPITTDLLATVSYWIKKLRGRLQEDCSITISQYRVLSCLEQQKRALHPHEIAEMCEITPSTITYIVNRLEEYEFLQRNDDPSNNRVVKIELLPRGSEMAQKGYAVSKEVKDEMIYPLGEYLKGAFARGIETYEDNYLLQARTNKYLADGTSLNTLILYENKLNDMLKGKSLSNNEFRVLFELSQTGRELRVTDLARLLLAKNSDITVACNKLENKGYVRKWHNNSDKREIVLEITSSGYEKTRGVAPLIDHMFLQTSGSATLQDREIELKVSTLIAHHQRKSFVCS